MVKHRRLDHNIYISFTGMEIVYLVRKKLVILKQQKTCLNIASFFFIKTLITK